MNLEMVKDKCIWLKSGCTLIFEDGRMLRLDEPLRVGGSRSEMIDDVKEKIERCGGCRLRMACVPKPGVIELAQYPFLLWLGIGRLYAPCIGTSIKIETEE